MSNVINAKTHPISFKKLTDYLLSQVGSSPELAEHAQLISAASAQMALNTAGGVVIEWLDSLKLFVITDVDMKEEDWNYRLETGEKTIHADKTYSSRKEAEKAGIEAAMDILEKQ